MRWPSLRQRIEPLVSRLSERGATFLAFWRRWGGAVVPLLLLASGAELIHVAPPGTQAARADALTLFLEAVFHASLALGLLWALLRARLTAMSTALWLVAVAVCVWYIAVTPYTTRGYDAHGHLDYVEIIAIGLRIPSPQDCWVCYHPPLYYLAVAPFFRVFLMTPHLSAHKELQVLGGELFALQLLYFFRLVEAVLSRTIERVGAALLVICLPLTALCSGRIGNDILLYLLWMAAVYHAARWEETLERRRLVLAFLFLSLGLVTKMSIAVPAAAIALAVATALLQRAGHRREILRQCAAAAALPVIPLTGYVYWSRTFISNGITGNIKHMFWMYRIPATFLHAVTFDLPTFLTTFAHPKDDTGGRLFFWVFWLKTALVGGWTYHEPGTYFFMRGLALFSLALIALALFAAVRCRAFLLRTTPTVLVWMVVVAPLASLVYWKSNGFSSSGDARYVYPVFPIAAVVFSRLQAGMREAGDAALLAASYVAEAAFLICGAGFLLALLIGS